MKIPVIQNDNQNSLLDNLSEEQNLNKKRKITGKENHNNDELNKDYSSESSLVSNDEDNSKNKNTTYEEPFNNSIKLNSGIDNDANSSTDEKQGYIGQVLEDIYSQKLKKGKRKRNQVDKKTELEIQKRVEKRKRKKLKWIHDNEVMFVTKNNIIMKRRDFNTLMPNNWLNDQPLNYIMLLIQEKRPKCLCVDSLFYTILYEKEIYDFGRVKRWKLDIVNKDLIIFPVNIGNQHWCLATANFEKQELQYYDSQDDTGIGKICLTNLLKYLHDSFETKTDFEFVSGEWELKVNN